MNMIDYSNQKKFIKLLLFFKSNIEKRIDLKTNNSSLKDFLKKNVLLSIQNILYFLKNDLILNENNIIKNSNIEFKFRVSEKLFSFKEEVNKIFLSLLIGLELDINNEYFEIGFKDKISKNINEFIITQNEYVAHFSLFLFLNLIEEFKILIDPLISEVERKFYENKINFSTFFNTCFKYFEEKNFFTLREFTKKIDDFSITTSSINEKKSKKLILLNKQIRKNLVRSTFFFKTNKTFDLNIVPKENITFEELFNSFNEHTMFSKLEKILKINQLNKVPFLKKEFTNEIISRYYYKNEINKKIFEKIDNNFWLESSIILKDENFEKIISDLKKLIISNYILVTKKLKNSKKFFYLSNFKSNNNSKIKMYIKVFEI